MKKSYPINKKISDFKHLNETFDKKKNYINFNIELQSSRIKMFKKEK